MSRFWDWLLGRPRKIDGAEAYSPEKSERRKRDGIEPAPLPESAGWPSDEDTEDPPYEPQEGELPSKGRPFSEWEEGRDYFSTRTYMAHDSANKDKDGNVHWVFQAVDTHTDVSFAYCQKGHLHEYHNGTLVAYENQISKHYVRTQVADHRRSLGWADKTIVEVEACDA